MVEELQIQMNPYASFFSTHETFYNDFCNVTN